MILCLLLLLPPVVMLLCFKSKEDKKIASSTERPAKAVTQRSTSPAAVTRPSLVEKKTTAEELEERANLLAPADNSRDAFPPMTAKKPEEQENKSKDVQKVQTTGTRKQQTLTCPPSNDIKFRTAESPKHNADASMSARDKSNKWWSSKEVMKNSEYFGEQSTQTSPTNTPKPQ